MIHPSGSALLGITFPNDFIGIPKHVIPGVGTASAWEEDAIIDLTDTDGTVDTLTGPILVAEPSKNNANHPNLFGRDVFDSYRINYHRAAGLVELHY